MDASKLTDGSGAEALTERVVTTPKTVQTKAVRGETKKIDKKRTAKKTETKRPTVKSSNTSKSEKLVCRYCGSKNLAPSFIKRRDRRCRKCFSKRYGSSARTGKTKIKR